MDKKYFLIVILVAGFFTSKKSAEAFILYNPLFTSTSSLTSTSGLTTGVGGGLVAQTAGVSGVGYVNFPNAININSPWKYAVLFEYNGDKVNSANVQLLASTTVANNDLTGFASQIAFTGTTTAFLDISNNMIYHGQPLNSGQKYWAVAGGDGRKVTIGILPFDQRRGLRYSFGGVDQTVNTDLFTSLSTSTVYHSGFPWQVNAFTDMERIKFTNSSTSTKILGFYINTDSAVGTTSDSIFNPPGIIHTTVNGDTTVVIRFPKNYDGIAPIDVIYLAHPNGSDECDGSCATSPDQGQAFASLVDAGYIVVYSRGDSSSYTSPLASPWGASPGLAARKDVLDYVKSSFGPVRKVYWVGTSMGLLDGLNFNMQYPNYLSGIAGISGVTNLSYAYNTEGFSGTINTAHATSSLAGIASTKDPNLNPLSFVGMPLKLWHGTADTLIHKTNHPDLFKTNIENVGGSVDVISVSGAGHKNVPSLYDGAALVNFFSDETVPTLSQISTTTSSTTANISWNTNEMSTTQVDFGVSKVLTASSSFLVAATTTHSVSLSSFSPCTIYYTKIKSRDIKYNIASSSLDILTTPGCTGSSEISTSTSQSINGSGSLVLDNVILNVPASFSATTTSAVFQAKKIDPVSFLAAVSAPEGKNMVGDDVVNLQAFISATSTLSTFTTPLTISMAYDTDDISNLNESSLQMYRYDASTGWTALSSCSIDSSNRVITCATDHFSDFAIFGTVKATAVNSTYFSPGSSSGPSFTFPTQQISTNNSTSTITPQIQVSMYTFTKSLTSGRSSPEVKNLQRYLNSKGFTVSKAGPGSAGKETATFGPATKAALIKFQKANGIKPASGFFGPITRAFIAK
ncbi:peptidoglycan-binding protein [Candidatus Parcubacteria bacterium]|nr:peptidoglycan-binding protein [Candidatus Parcubacteria bacterium]